MLRFAAILFAVTAPAALAAPPARAVKEDNALYSFSYTYPAAAGTIPGLRASLDADLATRLAKLQKDARTDAAEAKAGGFPYRKYDWTQSWLVVSNLPGWLSLSATYYSYTGGAHGMTWAGSMLWDRRAARARSPLDLFVSRVALAKAIRAPFCDELDRQRAKKRGHAVTRTAADDFDACIDPTAQTVILGSRGGQGFDRLGILVAPYSAGPYAEGTYEVTVPVTPAVLAAVKPAFRASFDVR
ncbi:DUF3298 and DUF4163 domain-containing protein [Novosphingobium flavum]|uniref:DUF3298 and DUF4163 domain-containing protein n=1 Tax=Novosphingobium flavum TaxID=1778672 RepID=A0A7X1KK99_9SPHN|nr:DUF4163 domain-containing protein [Novosphingobium flavum]MBC2663960.1 DUF3298 and DUF4163 domain-containing protein [Novosphingobium flavum]